MDYIPDYGFKVNLDHKYPNKWTPSGIPSISILCQLLPLLLRLVIYYIIRWWQKRPPFIDLFHPKQSQQIYGVPLGGIGCGSIGRGFRGEFCRFQMKPGIYEYETVHADQFIITIRNKCDVTILQSLLSTYPYTGKCLKSWRSHIDGSRCRYTGLYPRSWTEYDLSEYGIYLVCRQISPIIPHNYKDSALPCSAFVWYVQNVGTEPLCVTITFTIQNGIGVRKEDSKSMCRTAEFSYGTSEGMQLHHVIDQMPCTYAICVNKTDRMIVSKCLQFDPESDGSEPWQQLSRNGTFDNNKDCPKKCSSTVVGQLACGIAAQVEVNPGESDEMEFGLVWNMPVIQFPCRGRKYQRYYSQFFGCDNATLKIVEYMFSNFRTWEKLIYEWQQPVLADDRLPAWYKSALFNETYFVSDGGSIWLSIDHDERKTMATDDPRLQFGRFAYLEGHEYRMYNTYDVHFYASNAMIANWPLLQCVIQYEFRDAIFRSVPDKVTDWFSGRPMERKVGNSVPHDLGDPGEEPFLLPNVYCLHNVSEWRDLNTKFVLQVIRDYRYFNELGVYDGAKYLWDMYEACTTIMAKTENFDVDCDGLIENGGFPDQTYDAWIMEGSSAYCGGLWLAALQAMVTISEVLGIPDQANYYADLLCHGQAAFTAKLWTGEYYRYDCKPRIGADTIMADQLCGHWYLRLSGYEYQVFPKCKVVSVLHKIFSNNVMSFRKGTLGAVNGFLTTGVIDRSALQSEEVWIGVTYALAASMIQEGMLEQAWQTAGGMFRTMTEELGLIYQTPEALIDTNHFRSLGYMRPLSIWSMQLAWKDAQSKV